jgi:energy-coupling factor transporter ATP-binding protein EcfA2
VTDDREGRIDKAVRDMLIEKETPDQFLGKYPTQLSGGQRQRMALATAIAHDPAVLFADEPTASLDDKSSREVLDRIRGWLDHGDGSRAFVFATHRTETLHKHVHAQWVLELSGAKEEGSTEIRANWRPITSAPFVPVE